MAAIVFKDVVKSFDNGKVTVIPDLSFEIKDKEFVVLVGPSGCGKSTTLRMIAGLEEITSGELYIDERRVNDVAPKDRDIAMVFQSYALYPHMTVYKNMAFALKLKKLPKREIDEKVRWAADILDITPYLDRRPRALSGGQRQRICIARALALNPDFIVCDEPVSALDVSIQAQIINLLKQLQKDFGFTYLFISHDLSVVEHISDTVGVMYLGSMVEYADTDKIFSKPLHPYTEALFSAIPVPDPDVKMQRIILQGSLPSPANPPAGCKFHTRCHKCMEVCKYAVPEWTQVEPEHWCACHLYNDAERAGRAEAAMAQAKSGAKPKVEKDEEKKAV